MKFNLLWSLLLVSVLSFSQTKEDAKKDAQATATATLEMNFDVVLKHTYPKVVELMGGKDAAKTLLTSTFDAMKEQGFVFEKADIISVSDVIKEQDQHRCVVEGYNQMTMSGQRIKSKSYLLGIYDDTEKFWYFLEAKQLKNSALVEQILPGFETKLDIPDDDVQVEEIKE